MNRYLRINYQLLIVNCFLLNFRKTRRQEVTDNLALIVAETVPLMFAVVFDWCFIGSDHVIVEEEVVPEPEPEDLLFLLGRVLIRIHIIEAACVDHCCTADVYLIGGTPKILTNAMQEIVEGSFSVSLNLITSLIKLSQTALIWIAVKSFEISCSNAVVCMSLFIL